MTDPSETQRPTQQAAPSAPRRAPATVVEQAYQTWLWLDQAVTRFPKQARAQLGRRVLDAVLAALTDTAEAALRPPGRARVAQLHDANRQLTVLRLLLRGACERRYLAGGQHEHVSRMIDDWGRQLGGWLRHERMGRGQRRREEPPR